MLFTDTRLRGALAGTRGVCFLVLGALALSACGSSDVNQTESRAQHEEFGRLFAENARTYSIPDGLLETIAYVETRWHPAGLQTSTEPGDDENDKVVGIMGLEVNGSGGHSVAAAAAASGLSAEEISQSTESNIRAAAALLAKLAKKRGVSGSDLSAWIPVVRDFGSFANADDEDTWIASIYLVLRDGVDQDGILIDGRPSLVVPAAKNPPASPWVDSPNDIALGKPAVAWAPSVNYVADGIGTPKYIIIHTTEGEFNTSVSWLRSSGSGVSAHFVIRSSDGYIKQLVKEKDRAWHANCWNSMAIGIEHEAFMARPTKYFTDAMYNASAKLVGYLTRKYSIPRTNIRIVGHNFWQSPLLAQSGLPKCNSHTDPGSGWDWTRYLGLVQTF